MNSLRKRLFVLRVTCVLLSFVSVIVWGVVDPPHLALAATNITIDGNGSGRMFDGIGSLSAGASSALLIQYPEPQRSQILDYLFKPNYGASLQILKVEIGGDTNSTDGAEPSHEHTSKDVNYRRGYEWWLMQQAKARNPNIKIWGLEWGAPSWLGGICTAANAQYVADWAKGAQSVYNIGVDYVGVWNESSCGSSQDSYIKALRNTLNSNGLTKVNIVAPDLFDWSLVGDMQADPVLASAVYAVGEHYQNTSSTTQAQNSGYRLWSSEDGPWNNTAFTGSPGQPSIAQILNQNYVNGKMTSTTTWALESSYYPNLPLSGAGLMTAEEPWSGHYSVDPAIWAMAHTTQFTSIGWQYLDGASALLSGGGSYVTLKSPHHADWSTIIETVGANQNQTLNFTVTGGLSSSTVHVWRSTQSAYFQSVDTIRPVNGVFSLTVQPNALYTLTTTTGQHKGTISGSIPPSRPFPATYSDTFDAYRLGETNPKYLMPQNGAYEVQGCIGGRTGNCLAQVVDVEPTKWDAGGDPLTLLGDSNWINYSVRVDANLQETGYAEVTGRISSFDGWTTGNADGYQLEVYDSGIVKLVKGSGHQVLSTTTASIGTNAWHRLQLTFAGSLITASIDGNQVIQVSDADYPTGMAGFGTGWNKAQFDNLSIQPASAPQGSFVTGVATGREIRNNYNNYVGMQITVGASPIVVSELGRYFVAGNTGTHTLEIVRASDKSITASVSLAMTSGTEDSLDFEYATLSELVRLSANTTYYVVSLESNGGDQWYGTSATGLPTLTTTSVATINNAIYFDGTNWLTNGSNGRSYGPVNFKYKEEESR